jgi:enoyl-CoA hydratase
MYQSLLTSLENGIITVTINRPDKLNALNKTVIEELGKLIRNIYEDPSIKAAVITGAGAKSFVAGADISEFLELDGNDSHHPMQNLVSLK